jgi:hypothetical protein
VAGPLRQGDGDRPRDVREGPGQERLLHLDFKSHGLRLDGLCKQLPVLHPPGDAERLRRQLLFRGNFTGKGFLDVAFTEAEKAYITTTTVDNSAATTESSSNSYACANTSDKIFALSYQDFINTSYGFNSSYSNYDTARRGVLTDYARATGAWMSTDPPITGTVVWWSRSPSASYSYNAGTSTTSAPSTTTRLRGLWRPSELHREHRLSEAKQSIRRRERIRA